MRVQFTLFSTAGKYRPIATTLNIPNIDDMYDAEKAKVWKKKAVAKIAGERYRTGQSLIDHGFTQMKWRIYDEQERKANARKRAIAEMMVKQARGN